MTHQLEVAKRLAQLRRIKQVEEQRDIQQSELAAVIGTTPESYGRYENGRRKVPDEAILALAEYYGVSPSYIRYGEVSERPIATGLPVNHAAVEALRLARAAKQVAAQDQPRPRRRRGPR